MQRMRTMTSKSRQNFFTIATIIGLLVIFSFYFFIYIPRQESSLQKENFRVLSKITGNIEGRVNEYRQYINDRARISVYYAPYFETEQDEKNFSIFDNNYTRTLSTVFLDKRPELEVIYFCPAGANPDQTLIRGKLDRQPNPYFLFVRDTCSYNGEHFEYGFTLNSESIQYLLHENAFENYLLRREDKIISGPEAGVLAGAEDSLLKSINGLKTGRVFSQEISGSVKKIFAQPFRLGTEENFVLCGIMDQDDYHKKTRNLSGTVILIILLILFMMALSLPFVKFLLMSRSERLNTSDAFLAGITVMLGTSVAMLVLLDIYTYYIPARETRMQQLRQLSENISTNFEKEISASCRQLEIYDSLIGADSSGIFFKNLISIRDTNKTIKIVDEQGNEEEDTGNKLKIVRPTAYPDFSQVFWTDSSGQQLFKWSTTSRITPLIRVDERSYFKNISGEKVWSLPGKYGKEFYLEGIYSWTTGENMAVIAEKSNHKIVMDSLYKKSSRGNFQTRMIAMTTILNSVMNPILPMSNGFCIIDSKGEVIFHSDGNKNLAENLLDECTARDEIESAMYSRTPAFFSTGYQGGDYKMFIRPLDKLPFYLVTFQDNLYGVTSNTEVLSLSVLLVLFFFLFICVQVLLLRLITSKPSLLKAKDFSMSWLWPVKEKQQAYQQIILFLLLAFVLLVYFLRKAGPVEILLMFFTSSVVAFVFCYLKIDQFRENGQRKSLREFMSAKNKLVLGCGLSILVIVNIFSGYFIDHFSRYCFFQAILCTLAAALMIVNVPAIKSFTYRKSYFIFQLGILSLVSIIPTFAFFRISFEKEAEIRIRHGQLELAAELNRKSDQLNKAYRFSDSLQKDVYASPFYNTRFSPGKFRSFGGRTNSVSAEEDVFSEISVSLTPSYNNIVTKEHDLASPALDGSWKWRKEPPHSLRFNYFDLQKSAARGVDSLTIISDIPAYKLPLPFGAQGFGIRGTLFWIGILACLVVLYLFIRYFVRTIFSTDFFIRDHYSDTGITSVQSYFEEANVFLVGVPHSGKTTWLKKNYGPDKSRHHINLGTLKTPDDIKTHLEKCEKAEIIIIDHFEYGFRDYAVARRRLKLFEGLANLGGKQVLVMSNIHPSMFIKDYPEPPEKPGEDETNNKAKDRQVFGDKERWVKILGRFHKVYFPAAGVGEAGEDAPQTIVDKECRRSFFLSSKKEFIQESLRRENYGHELSDEEIILRIESIAHVYYNSIWSSLSEEEQYVLYDIAQDGLVNLKNREVLIMLLNKGILVYDSRFRIMNESFRNFVLAEVSADDALMLERSVKETGSWNYFKTPVVIILITIALFIFITQQETFNSIIAFITTFAAGIPIIFRLLGMITSMKGAKGLK